ncbi:MAG TPA: PAS domain S-box protein [Burkholderiales bacterium]|nr:PAS domain S-box protein [Burkholderiales bacterium]
MTLYDWVADSLLGKASHAWVRYLAAGLVTLLSIFIVAVLWRRMGAIPDPGLILLLTVAAATYLAGGMAGMLSAAIVLFCSFVLFSHPLYPFRYSEMDWRQMMVIIVACPIIALMVGSLKEQVDRLKIVTREAQALKEEVQRLEVVRESQFLCEQRFRLMADCMPDYAVCVLDANGSVRNWNPGAERLLGYSDPEIVGQSYSRFFAKEDLLARQPERLLEHARFSGRVVEEGWRLRKGGGRIRATTTLLALKNLQGVPAGCLMVMRATLDSPDITHKS